MILSKHRTSVAALTFLLVMFGAEAAYACCSCGTIQKRVNRYTTERMRDDYIPKRFLGEFFHDRVLGAQKDIADQLTALAIGQMRFLAEIVDGETQQRVELNLQKRKVKALVSQKPDVAVCTFDSVMQSSLASENNGELAAKQYSAIRLQDVTGKQNASGDEGIGEYRLDLYSTYVTQNCDPNDEGGSAAQICSDTVDPANMDADAMGDMATLTQEIDGDQNASDDEKNMAARQRLLTGHPPVNVSNLNSDTGKSAYVRSREYASQAAMAGTAMDARVARTAQGTGNNNASMQAIAREAQGSDAAFQAEHKGKPSSDAQIAILSKDNTQSMSRAMHTITSEENVERQILKDQELGVLIDSKVLQSTKRGNLFLAQFLNGLTHKRQAELDNAVPEIDEGSGKFLGE